MKYKEKDLEFSSNVEDIPNFSPTASASICFIEASGKILLVKKDPHRFKYINCWGLPGGKLEANETPLQALEREILEETALKISPASTLLASKLHVRIPQIDYVLYVFKTTLNAKPEDLDVRIDNVEHCEFAWATPQQALEYNLMFGGNELIRSIF